MLSTLRQAHFLREDSANYWKPLKLDSDDFPPWCSYAADMTTLAEQLNASSTWPIGKSLKSLAYRQHIQLLQDRRLKGLMRYDTCSYEELHKFCNQRHVPGPEMERPKSSSKELEEEADNSKRELMTALLEADENHTFDRFTELPPELRNLIYGFSYQYFEDWRSHGATRTPPPIAQVCRLIRNETLPLFYQTNFFFADFEGGPSLGFDISRANDFVNIAPDLFALVRTRTFGLDCADHWRNWTVELDLRGSGYQVRFMQDMGSEASTPEDPIAQRVDQKLREVIEAAASRVGENGTIELRPPDWSTIRDFFETAQKELYQKFIDDESDDE